MDKTTNSTTDSGKAAHAKQGQSWQTTTKKLKIEKLKKFSVYTAQLSFVELGLCARRTAPLCMSGRDVNPHLPRWPKSGTW